MKRQKLSKEEQELENSFDSLDWTIASKNEVAAIEQAAARSAQERNKVNRASVRFSHQELEIVKRKADAEAIDYHAWIRSVAVRAARGQLVDVTMVKTLIGELTEHQAKKKKTGT